MNSDFYPNAMLAAGLILVVLVVVPWLLVALAAAERLIKARYRRRSK